jgi:hypothetical protein
MLVHLCQGAQVPGEDENGEINGLPIVFPAVVTGADEPKDATVAPLDVEAI